jgi:polysaccharide chain length determinant protein (PEP-CTERM system associated)
MIPGKSYTFEDFLWMGWRRKWLIILPFLLVCAVTVTWVHRLPNLYRSETVILVVPQRVPDTYVRSTVTSRIEDRLQSISPEILSRTRLEKIIQELDLYPEQRKTLTMEEVVEIMRLGIKADPIKETAFQVSYVSNDPVKAMEVTKRLASMFIEENLRDRETIAEGTNQFLESQLQDARLRLVEQEKQLAEYRKRHAGELPSQVDSNLQSIQNAQMQLQALGESISRDRDRLTIVEGLITDASVANTSQMSAQSISIAVVDPFASVGSIADRLHAARTSLTSLQTRLTSEHPDIIRLKRLIRDLESAAEVETRRHVQADVTAHQPLTAAEVVKRGRLREMQGELKTLRQRINHDEVEQQRLRHVIATYERRVEAAPNRESELSELMRDYETLRELYASLLTRREDSKIAANLERRQVGEQFRILDPPQLPEKPFSPDRIRFNAIGALLGLGLGIGLAALFEYRDTSLHTEDDVVTSLALPVVALIPLMVTRAEYDQRRRRKLIFCGAATGVLLASAAATMVAWKVGIFG